MKKYFLYELKKNRFTILMVTIIISLIYCSTLIPDFSYFKESGNMPSSGVEMIVSILTTLCTFVPIYVFFFKTRSRQVDLMLAMPLKKWKIYGVKSLIGLLIVFIPYTIAYWLGFFVAVIYRAPFDFIYYVPLYFITIPLGFLLFGLVSFAFTRANHVIDGYIISNMYLTAGIAVAFIIAAIAAMFGFNELGNYIFFFLPNNSLSAVASIFNGYISDANLFTFSSIFSLFSFGLNSLLLGDSVTAYLWVSILFLAVLGLAAWFGMFYLLKYDKPEKAEHVSDSRFGYIPLIPIYILALSILGGALFTITPILSMFIIIGGYVSYIIFRRTGMIKLADLITLLSAAVLGNIIGALMGW